MKQVAILASIVLVLITSNIDQTQSATVPPITDPFLQLIKEIEQSTFFPNLATDKRVLTFEMLTAAETKHLTELLDRIGYVELFSYIDVLPMDYQHQFISYSIAHLKMESPDLGLDN